MKYFTVIVSCLVVGWLFGAILGIDSFDPFDDSFWPWVLLCMLYFGTPIGVLFMLLALPLVIFRSRDLEEKS